MAGNDVAIDTFLREHGAVRVNLLDTLYEIIPFASRYCRITPSATTKPTVAVLTTTGGGAATVVDAMNQLGLKAAIPPDDFIEQTKTALQMELNKAPVMDVTLAASSAQYRQLLESLIQAPWCAEIGRASCRERGG